MKRKTFVLIIVLSLVMMLFSTAANKRGISFSSIRHVPGKGYVALFNLQGDWRQDELWGFVSLPRNRQVSMDCNFRDDGKASCVIAEGISQYEGRPVKLVVYGYPFLVTMPAKSSREIKFESISYTPGKGFVALFDIKGSWTSADLWGFVMLPNDQQIDMDCRFREEGKVGCVITSGLSQYSGKWVKLVVYGYPFDAKVPAKK